MDPVNPYKSCVVSASAGSGKTYQLSRRFLYLVGAGADPSSILTITFTKKAAAEMRGRILEEAFSLLQSHEKRQAFDGELREFHRTSEHFESLRTPISAQQAAEHILGKTQSLRITTIDSVFYDWIRRFPLEAGLLPGTGPIELATEAAAAGLDQQVWERLSGTFHQQSIPDLLTFAKQSGINALRNRLQGLLPMSTYLWLSQRLQHSLGGFNRHAVAEAQTDDASLLSSLAPLIRDIISVCSAALQESVEAALGTGSFDLLMKSGILSKTGSVSGRYLRGKKREELAAAIEQVESLVRDHLNQNILRKLNRDGALFCRLFSEYQDTRHQLKTGENQLEFSDLAKGCFNLFHGDLGSGPRYLLSRSTKHLLLDEFQDTSQLQWSIFSLLAEEILSGGDLTELGLPGTAFIVGDEKQSIYGFREADPEVMRMAQAHLGQYDAGSVTLERSFRSAGLIMDVANQVFSGKLANYQPHATAELGGTVVVPDFGRVSLSECFLNDDERLGIEGEAEFVATYLQEALAHPQQHPVYCKEEKTYRPLEPRDCAILFRYGTNSQVFEASLRERDLPYRFEDSRGFFAQAEIRDLVALLRFLYNPCDCQALCEILKSPITDTNDAVLLDLLHSTSDLNLAERANAILAKVGTIGIQIKKLVEASKTDLPHQLFFRAISEFQLLAQYQERFKDGDGELAVRNIMQLLDIIMQLESQGHTGGLALLLELERLAAADTYGNAISTSNAISLLTIHKSKGLEYPFVILVDTAKSWEKRDRYWAKGEHSELGTGVFYVGTKTEQPVKHPGFDAIFQSLDADLKAESDRLLYVALTRARQYLLVTGSQSSEKAVLAESPHACLQGALEALGAESFSRSYGSGLEIKRQEPVEFAQQRGSAVAPQQEITPNVQPWFPAEVATVRPHRLNRVDEPAEKSASGAQSLQPQRRGLLVHWLLEAHVKNIQWNFAAAQEALPEQDFDLEMDLPLYREAQTQAEMLLKSTAWQQLTANATSLRAEVAISAFDTRQSWMRGSIDLLVETTSGDLWVIDYKTSESPAQANRYLPQVSAYAAAVQQMHPEKRVGAGIMFTANQSLAVLLPLERRWPSETQLSELAPT